jgi:small subunit ribosomal protein S2
MSSNPNSSVLVDRLFKAGSHFGFKKSRRHPSMKPFLFGNKAGNDIFDLEHSATLIDEAKAVLEKFASEGKTVLFVGTKEEASKLVRETAEKLGTPFVTNRWVGGMITNWGEVRKRIARLFELVAQGESGELERKYTKKERVIIGREMDKLIYNFGGIRSLERAPDLMVIVDPRHEKLAVAEAKEKNISIIGIMSSDNNIKDVNYPVVMNDTLRPSIELVLNELVSAYEEGKKSFKPVAAEPARRRRVMRSN